MTGHSGSVLDVELDALLVLIDTLLLELVEVLGVLLLVSAPLELELRLEI